MKIHIINISNCPLYNAPGIEWIAESPNVFLELTAPNVYLPPPKYHLLPTGVGLLELEKYIEKTSVSPKAVFQNFLFPPFTTTENLMFSPSPLPLQPGPQNKVFSAIGVFYSTTTE